MGQIWGRYGVDEQRERAGDRDSEKCVVKVASGNENRTWGFPSKTVSILDGSHRRPLQCGIMRGIFSSTWCTYSRERECVCACARERVCVCARAREGVSVRVRERERERERKGEGRREGGTRERDRQRQTERDRERQRNSSVLVGHR
jgi:hypothetical protein